MKFDELRTKYDELIYEKYDIEETSDFINITYYFNVPSLVTFKPTLRIPKISLKRELDDFGKYLVFHIGLVELISYWKCCCPKHVIIKAGYIDKDQIEWFRKLYYYGLGEFFYVNHINVSYDSFMDVTCQAEKKNYNVSYKGFGNLIPVGGGKDSCVTLELLKKEDNTPFMINPKQVHLDCIHAAGYSDNQIVGVKRTIDKQLIDLNAKGYLNGHTPFSALVSFVTYLIAYLTNKRYITLSNEGSANEPTVIGTKINHQYSKTFEYENDFNDYTKKYFNIDIKYFSLLRPLSEFQIGLLFCNYPQYHKVFRSCNVGSKSNPWVWCGKCPKCLFVYIILSPKLYKDKLIEIFGHDLYEDETLLPIFKELTGNADTKPFECVGTIKEVRYALSLTIKKHNNLPYLLQYYKDNYDMIDEDVVHNYNETNNLDPAFDKIVREHVKCIMD